MKRLKLKSNAQTDAANRYSHGDFPMSDFIPYAVFYDEKTLLTKNGELMQTLVIPLSRNGLPSEEAEHSGVYLRDKIRLSIANHLGSPQFSYWMHVFRDKEAIEPLSTPTGSFAAQLQQDWLASQRTGHIFHNCCYLTVLVQGQPATLFSLEEFRHSGRRMRNRLRRSAYLTEQAALLNRAMEQVQAELSSHFKVDRLSLYERDVSGKPAYFSEQMEWLQRLVHLQPDAMPVSETDLSQQLDNGEMIFGFDALEARYKKHKRFASIISIKHYHELPMAVFDRFLQMPMEMVVTQASQFISDKTALKEVEPLRKILKQSEDGMVAQESGFLDVMKANQGGQTDFSTQQTTVMVLTDHYAELDELTTEIQTAISLIGLVSVREDIKLEEVFWSQLPGNFEFLRRMQAMPTNKTCGLARLNYYPAGKPSSRWGQPITVLPTPTRTPYLFHFHNAQGNGHSLLVDYNSFPDALGYRLTHFLMAQASKQVPRMVLFDRHGSGEMFVNHMRGQAQGGYGRIGGKRHNVSLNPLAMPCVPGNQGFLAAWLAMLLDVSEDDTQRRQAIRSCMMLGWTETDAVQGFAHLVGMMQQVSPDLAAQLRELMKKPVFGNVMAAGMDSVQFDGSITGINFNMDCFQEGSAVALFSLLLHRVIMTLDGQPTLLVVKDAWDVLNHPFFASRLQSLLDMLTERNAAVLFTTRDVEALPTHHITPIICGAVATTLLIPDDLPVDYLPQTFGLAKSEVTQLLKMERQKGEFMVLHDGEVIGSKLEIKNSQQQAILMGDAKTLQTMRSFS